MGRQHILYKLLAEPGTCAGKSNILAVAGLCFKTFVQIIIQKFALSDNVLEKDI